MSAASDVVVVGGGVIGSAVAWSLSRRGVGVTLVDKSWPGRASSASAGGLWPIGESIGLGCGVIFHATGGDGDGPGPEPLPHCFMNFLCESNTWFPQLRGQLLEQGGVDIEAEEGTGLMYLLYTEDDEAYADEVLAYILAGGRSHDGISRLTPEEAAELEPMVTRDLRGAVYFGGDNQVNPMLLTEALKRGACHRGATFLGETEVTGLKMGPQGITAVETTRGAIPCGAVVNAAGAWSAKLAAMAGMELPVYPVRGQIVCTEALRHRSLRVNLSTSSCYLLQKAHGEVIIGSTTEHVEYDTRVRLEDAASLAAGATRAIPSLGHARVKRTWAGLRPGTPDELPILGPVSSVPNYYNATGGFRTGIVAAPLSGELVAAWITGEALPFPGEPFLYERFEGRRKAG